jgi:hypothetical protein
LVYEVRWWVPCTEIDDAVRGSLIFDLSMVKSEKVGCFPASYKIMDFFLQIYDRHLVREVSSLYQVNATCLA